MLMTIEERVQNGVSLLNHVYGLKDWVYKIDLGNLQLQDATYCVIGQLFDGAYGTGKGFIFNFPKIPAGLDAWLCGFECVMQEEDYDEDEDEDARTRQEDLWNTEYEFLTLEWVRVITMLRHSLEAVAA